MWKPRMSLISPTSRSTGGTRSIFCLVKLHPPDDHPVGSIVSVAYKWTRRREALSKFPQTPAFTGFNTPSRIEADIEDLAVEGDIPSALNGAFYRVQPDPQFPPLLGDDIAFNGDGMIAMFRFENGKVNF